MQLRVWRLDPYGKIDIIAYGIFFLPNTPGHHEINCAMWRPVGSSIQEIMGFFLQSEPKLNIPDLVSEKVENRIKINSKTQGVVKVLVNVITKNMNII